MATQLCLFLGLLPVNQQNCFLNPSSCCLRIAFFGFAYKNSEATDWVDISCGHQLQASAVLKPTQSSTESRLQSQRHPTVPIFWFLNYYFQECSESSLPRSCPPPYKYISQLDKLLGDHGNYAFHRLSSFTKTHMLFNTVESHLRSQIPCVCSLPAVLQTKV